MFISIACQNMLIPSYSVIKEEFNIPEAYIALPDALFVLIGACFALLWGYYTDRINRTMVILAGAFSWTIGMLLSAFSSSFPMLLISRALSGSGLGCVLPVGYSIISDAVPPEERSSWFGMLAILSSISNGIGQGLSSFLGPILSWRFPFLLLSGISVFVIFILFFVKIPQRGASEDELIDLTELNLEYSYRISKEDLKEIVKKKTNRFLMVQGFFAIIPGTILVYFMLSMLSTYYFNELPSEIRLQTASIFAGMIGIGYLLGNALLSKIGDYLYKKNKVYRAKFATVCMFVTVPLCILILFSIKPISTEFVNNMNYPDPIPTGEIVIYIVKTIGEIFVTYPNYVYYFIFAFFGSLFSTGWVSNKTAVMIDVNLPEHKGTATSFFSLSEQIGKGLTLIISFSLITILGSIFNMMLFAIFLWVPAGILWFLASMNVVKDMKTKSRILSERSQNTLIDFIFELEIQLDRAIQKVQDSKYYIKKKRKKFNNLLKDAIRIFEFCEREGISRSMTNIEKKAHILKLKTIMIRQETKNIYRVLDKEKLPANEKKRLEEDLIQIKLKISEFEKSTFMEIQIYLEVAYLKIVEARLLRKTDLIKSLTKLDQAINAYNRINQLLKERLENVDKKESDEEGLIIYEKEKELFRKSNTSLLTTLKIKEEYQVILNQLEQNGITKEDLSKLSELAEEYNVDIYKIIMETFGKEYATINSIKEILDKIEGIFDHYDTSFNYPVF